MGIDKKAFYARPNALLVWLLSLFLQRNDPRFLLMLSKVAWRPLTLSPGKLPSKIFAPPGLKKLLHDNDRVWRVTMSVISIFVRFQGLPGAFLGGVVHMYAPVISPRRLYPVSIVKASSCVSARCKTNQE